MTLMGAVETCPAGFDNRVQSFALLDILARWESIVAFLEGTDHFPEIIQNCSLPPSVSLGAEFLLLGGKAGKRLTMVTRRV